MFSYILFYKRFYPTTHDFFGDVIIINGVFILYGSKLLKTQR